jgi:hypothetical protein
MSGGDSSVTSDLEGGMPSERSDVGMLTLDDDGAP